MIDNVILLYSEITKGMKSYGPKAFIPIGHGNKQKPLVIRQIDNAINKYGLKTKIYVIIGFEQEKFTKILDQHYPKDKYSNIIYVYNENYEESNNAHSFSLALDLIDSGNAIVIQNGILTNYYPKKEKSSILPILKNNQKDELFNIGVTSENKKVEYVFYDLPKRWSEILYINHNDVYAIKKILSKHDIKQKFLFEIINILIDNNIHFETEYVSLKDISKITNHKK